MFYNCKICFENKLHEMHICSCNWSGFLSRTECVFQSRNTHSWNTLELFQMKNTNLRWLPSSTIDTTSNGVIFQLVNTFSNFMVHGRVTKHCWVTSCEREVSMVGYNLRLPFQLYSERFFECTAQSNNVKHKFDKCAHYKCSTTKAFQHNNVFLHSCRRTFQFKCAQKNEQFISLFRIALWFHYTLLSRKRIRFTSTWKGHVRNCSQSKILS